MLQEDLCPLYMMCLCAERACKGPSGRSAAGLHDESKGGCWQAHHSMLNNRAVRPIHRCVGAWDDGAPVMICPGAGAPYCCQDIRLCSFWRHCAVSIHELTQCFVCRLNVTFQKRPNEGSMKGLAFIKDPDG